MNDDTQQAPETLQHGILEKYDQGCRCEDCRSVANLREMVQQAEMWVSPERLAVLECFGDGDIQDICAEILTLRKALSMIRANANRSREWSEQRGEEQFGNRFWLNVELILDEVSL